MNISRNFLIIGSLYLTIGVLIGMYMGGSGDHTLAPLHAHINLLGFTLSVWFAISYRVFAEMGANRMAVWHFWLHTVGGVVLLVMLALLMTGNVGEDSSLLVALPIAELAILLGVISFLVNAWRNAN
jgi:hypothetical protein